MDSNAIRALFQRYADNILENAELDEELYETENKKDWLRHHRARSLRLREMLAENTDILAKLFTCLEQEELTEDTAKAFLDGAVEMYRKEADDHWVLLKVVDVLLPYYEAREDVDALVALCMVADYEFTVYEQNLTPKSFWHNQIPYQERIRQLRKYYGPQLERDTRSRIFDNYYNMAVIAPMDQQCISGSTYGLLKEMQDFWHSEMVQQLDGEDERIKDTTDTALSAWLAEAWYCDDLSPEAKAFLIEQTPKYCEKAFEEADEEQGVETEACFAYVLMRLDAKEITPARAVEELHDYFAVRTQYLQKQAENQDKRYLTDMKQQELELAEVLTNYAPRLCEIIQKYHLDPGDYQGLYEELGGWYLKYWKCIRQTSPITFFDSILSGGFLEMMENISDEEFRVKLFDVILLRRYAFNFIHFEMVSRLASRIAEAMLRDRPELFAGIFGYSTGEVQEHSQELVKFITLAGKYHDIGKIKIGRTIETQYRKLCDGEFEGIKAHPEYGSDVANKLKFLEPYRDVILGHHKFYNGRGGYPAGFDNTKSPLKPIIDLITLCDCLDAATDRLGRNYAVTKTVDDLMAEFHRDKGVRYNPDMVEYLKENVELKKDLEYLVDEGRREICYRIFEEQGLK